MFRIKICGVTTVEDARFVRDAGADAIGLNFYSSSPRSVSMDAARAIANALRGSVELVGVFVNATRSEIAHIADEIGLDRIQLHGDESAAFAAELRPRRIVRAFRCRDGGWDPVMSYLADCGQTGEYPSAILLDAYQPGSFGGTGQTLDWDALARFTRDHPDPPVVLAGGLNPDNVAQAIRSASPAAVDTASGVERDAGRKDHVLVQRFVVAAQNAFDALGCDVEAHSPRD